jgi:hypothetical protein
VVSGANPSACLPCLSAGRERESIPSGGRSEGRRGLLNWFCGVWGEAPADFFFGGFVTGDAPRRHSRERDLPKMPTQSKALVDFALIVIRAQAGIQRVQWVRRTTSWIPAFAGMTIRARGMTEDWIPAFAGMTIRARGMTEDWIPACAGMTIRARGMTEDWIPACAGMTVGVRCHACESGQHTVPHVFGRPRRRESKNVSDWDSQSLSVLWTSFPRRRESRREP